MKSCGIYETPGGTLLLEALRGIEQITLDRGAACDAKPSIGRLAYSFLRNMAAQCSSNFIFV